MKNSKMYMPAKAVLKKKNKAEGIPLPVLKLLYYKALIIKTTQYWQKKNRYKSMEELISQE